MKGKSLFDRLGGYSAIVTLVDSLVSRLEADPQLGRFWANRGTDGILREKQLLVDFLCKESGGPMYYCGRDMLTTHKGMNITPEDWQIFLQYLSLVLDQASVDEPERSEVVEFIKGLSDRVVETEIAASA
tara:strand:+ start:1444 stop:1833 length:390 start_codon:yes stop_codon:yes gene_type:complete